MPEQRDVHEPQPPSPEIPDASWEHREVWDRIQIVLKNLPQYFQSAVTITGGIPATEIFVFGATMSSVIESEIVRTLNSVRTVWDPDGHYRDYILLRQPERFPDILFLSPQEEPVFGIELKSWYLLSKEGEPSFRYTVSEKVPTVQDLFVVVPWVLSNVLSGVPVVYKPYVESAKYIARLRNYWWQRQRKSTTSTHIESPRDASHYPPSRAKINDVPASDSGHNFGRIARIGTMDEWVNLLNKELLLGIPVEQWREFFRTSGEKAKQPLSS